MVGANRTATRSTFFHSRAPLHSNMLLQVFFVSTVLAQVLAEPLLFSAPQVLSFVSSASSASSGPSGNIARIAKSEDSLDDDDFFKDSLEDTKDDALSNLLVQKIGKIVQKFQFLASLTEDQKKDVEEQDDFDKDFNEDFKEGYVYNKPKKIQKSAKQEAEGGNKLDPANIGVYFMELIGSLVGLVYGAAAQSNIQGTSTTAAPN